MNQYSDNGINFTQGFEGCYLIAYQDTGKVWTIGIGTIKYPNGVAVKKGDKITLQQAKEYFQHDIKECVDSVNKFNSNLQQHEFDMLVDSVYNCGAGFLDSFDGPQAFTRWISDNGAIYNGLMQRRCLASYIYQRGYTEKALKYIADRIKSGK